jgi:ABC-2 type transport system permease protein
MIIAERILNIPLVRKNDALRTFTVAAWLGWQIESNWADPFLFAIYSFARPVASVLILVVMYNVITDGATGEPIFAYIYLGNALYILVSQVITGISWTVIDDREHYRTARQLHTTPMSGYFYLMGRGVAQLIIGTISVLITIGFGMVVFKLPISAATINWPLLLGSTALGVIALACIGLVMGSATMMMARHFWSIGTAVAGGLYLFTGAIFPLDVLPVWLRPIGFALPVTYWLEVARRAMLGPQAAAFPTLARFSSAALMGILLGFCVVLGIVSVFFYRWALRRAKQKGLIDMETSY